MIKILITGANSYIGTSFEKYIKDNFADCFCVETIDTIDGTWQEKNFEGFDAIFHVAGIAHSDYGNISRKKELLYRSINTDLTVKIAKKAKKEGVRQFVFMSSAIVYGSLSRIGKDNMITKETIPSPSNCYGDSKLQAEKQLLTMASSSFNVAIIRSPMIYGDKCKGNFNQLIRYSRKMHFFPYVNNKRSMLYIKNLVEFVRLIIVNCENGIFWPQNNEYSCTSDVVKKMSELSGNKMHLLKCGWVIKIASFFLKKLNKAFGNLTYDKSISSYKCNYCLYSLDDSLKDIIENANKLS